MNSIQTKLIFLLIILLFNAPTAHSQQRDHVFVSILPQKFFVQQISGDNLTVEVMVKPGANPATYEPKPSQMRKLALSRAYFAIGVPFENVWMEKFTAVNPNIMVVHTDADILKMAMPAHFHGEQQHSRSEAEGNPGAEKTGLDPHIWLAPTLVKKQAAIILATLNELFPEKAELFTTNYTNFIISIEALHDRLQVLLKDYRGREFMAFHPSWGYFARDYGLKQVPIEIEGKEPKPAQIGELIDFAKEHKIRVIFAQKQFSQKSAAIIAGEIGGEVVTIDPLAENWFANMEEIALKFKQALQ